MKKIKIGIYITIALIIMSIFYSEILTKKIDLTKKEFVDALFFESSIGVKKIDGKKLTEKLAKYFTNIDINKVSNYLDIPKSLIIDDLSTKEVSNQEETLALKNDPLIYIYNTHQTEEYDSDSLRAYNITPTVKMASYMLQDKLKEQNISSIVEETNIKKELNKQKLNYSESYKVTRNLLKKNFTKHPTIKYFIDIHRDSLSKKQSTITINNKSYAKIMFVIAMNNKNYKQNLSLMQVLNNKLASDYPNISRGIYKRNAVYNQDLNKNIILIEVGGNNNNIEEVYNSIDAISKTLAWYIKVYNE